MHRAHVKTTHKSQYQSTRRRKHSLSLSLLPPQHKNPFNSALRRRFVERCVLELIVALLPSRRVHRRRPDAVLEERQRVAQHRRQDIAVPVPHPEISHHHQAGVLQQHRCRTTRKHSPCTQRALLIMQTSHMCEACKWSTSSTHLI